MAAAVLNLKIEAGADYSSTLTFKDANGDPISQDGCVFAANIRSTVTDPQPAGSFTFTIPNQTQNAGIVYMSLPAAVSAALPVARQTKGQDRTDSVFVYDVNMTNQDGKTMRILEGTVTVSPEATYV